MKRRYADHPVFAALTDARTNPTIPDQAKSYLIAVYETAVVAGTVTAPDLLNRVNETPGPDYDGFSQAVTKTLREHANDLKHNVNRVAGADVSTIEDHLAATLQRSRRR